jgi:hypothetical protein
VAPRNERAWVIRVGRPRTARFRLSCGSPEIYEGRDIWIPHPVDGSATISGMTVHERPFGRYYEDFEPGDTYKHWPGKTITEYDDHLFCMGD